MAIDPVIREYVESSGIFAKDSAVEHLSTATADRVHLASSFSEVMNALFDALKKNKHAHEVFTATLDDVRVAGLIEMVKRHTGSLQYHLAEHAAEVMADTDKALMKIYNHKFPTESFNNHLMRQLAVSAAAWHDVVQSEGAPTNEIESAHEFSACLREQLNYFCKQCPALAELAHKFSEYVQFIANELIVYDTWLVFSMNENKRVVAKTLRQHTRIIEGSDHQHYQSTPILERLWLAADAISIADTSRFALEHVRQEKTLLQAVACLPVSAQQALHHFFTKSNIQEPAMQEEFLGLMGQDIRMFPELNTTDIAHISLGDYHYFIDSLNMLRHSGNNEDIDFKKLIDLFMTTLMKKALQTNIQQETNFAKAIGTGLWQRHASILADFEQHVQGLSDDEKANLSQALFILSTTFQPGRMILQADPAFAKGLEKALCSSPILSFFRLRKQSITDNLRLYQAMLDAQ